MFSVAQKRAIAGAEAWSWAVIRNNGAVPNPGVNPHNEAQEARSVPR